jgi:hypothetical protein
MTSKNPDFPSRTDKPTINADRHWPIRQRLGRPVVIGPFKEIILLFIQCLLYLRCGSVQMLANRLGVERLGNREHIL